MSPILRGCLYLAAIFAMVVAGTAAMIVGSAVIGMEITILVGMTVVAIVGAAATIRRRRRSTAPRTSSEPIAEVVRPLLMDGETIHGILPEIEVASDWGDLVMIAIGDSPPSRHQALLVTEQRVFHSMTDPSGTRRPRIVAEYSRRDVEVRDFRPPVGRSSGVLTLAIHGQPDLTLPLRQSSAEAASAVAAVLGARVDQAWATAQAADHLSSAGLTWASRLFGGLLGVLLTFLVFVPVGEPDAGEVTFVLSLFTIVAGVGLGVGLRGSGSPRLDLIGEAILGLGIGGGLGFVLVFIAPLRGAG